MTALTVQPARTGLLGSVPVPSDALQVQVALALAALASGTSEIRLRSLTPASHELLRALSALGVDVTATPEALHVRGAGHAGLRAPAAELAFGHNPLAAALAAALVAGQGLKATLSERGPAWRFEALAHGLSERGAKVRALSAPGSDVQRFVVDGAHDHPLTGWDTWTEVPDAALKAALLLSGLHAAGPTGIAEPLVSPDHAERLLRALGVSVGGMGAVLTLVPLPAGAELPAFRFDVPGDISLAAYVLAGAALVPGSRIAVRGVGLNPTRSGILDIMRFMGAQVVATPEGEQMGEPLGEVRLFHGPLAALALEGELRVRSSAELPVVCALAAGARGTSQIGELEPSELERADRLVALCAQFGVAAAREENTLTIEGRAGAPLAAAEVDCAGDAELGLAATLLALRATSACQIHSAGCIVERFPRFVGTLRALGVEIGVAA